MDAGLVGRALCVLLWSIGYLPIVNLVILTEGGTQTVCELEEFKASCGTAEVVHIVSAQFGHLHISSCAPFDNGQFGCKEDVTNILDERCAGKKQCAFTMPDTELLETRPCARGLATFLEAIHVCLRGNSVSSLCRPIPVSRTPAYFTSLAALRSQCSGEKGNRVQLTTEPGQKIRLTTTSPSTQIINSSLPVRDLISVTENGVAISPNVSNSEGSYADDKGEVYFLSVSNIMDVELMDNSRNENLVLSFQATGCLDYRPAVGMWQERIDDDVTVGCYSTDRTWTLQCVGSRWNGTVGDCVVKTAVASTTTEISLVVDDTNDRPARALSRGVMLVTIIASTLLLCAIVITAACVYIRCLKSKYQTKAGPKGRVQYALSPQDAAMLLGNGIQDGAQRNSWHNTMPLPQNNDQHGVARKDYMTMNVLPMT